MKNRKEEIAELLAKHDVRPMILKAESVNLFEVLLEEAFAEGYSFAKEEARLVSEAVKVLGK